MFATLKTDPEYCFSGNASTMSSTFCPAFTLLTSISFTYVFEIMLDISGRVATTLSHGDNDEPIFLLAFVLSLLYITIPSAGA